MGVREFDRVTRELSVLARCVCSCAVDADAGCDVVNYACALENFEILM